MIIVVVGAMRAYMEDGGLACAMTWINDPSGIAWYVGRPQYGKTYLALKHLAEIISLHKKPALVLDCGGVSTFVDKYHESKVLDVIDTLWQYRENCYYTQNDIEEVDKICFAFRKAGNGVLLVDEAIYTLNARGECSDELLKLMRTRGHSNTHILLTTQNLSSDIPQPAFSCGPAVHVFCLDALRSQELAEKLWGIPRSVSSTLPKYQWIQKGEGVENTPINPAPVKEALPAPLKAKGAPHAQANEEPNLSTPAIPAHSPPTAQDTPSTEPQGE